MADDLRTLLRDVPFIYDADRRVGRLSAPERRGRSRLTLELLSREQDDSYNACLQTVDAAGLQLVLADEHFAYRDNAVELHVPPLEFFMDPVYVRKFKAFMRGNVPTPDIAGRSILGPPGPPEQF